MYSLGWDCFEPGAVSQGFTNQWRIEQGINYFREGVNDSLTLVCDVTSSIELNEQRGSCIKSALNARDTYGINVRLLPLRPPSKDFCAMAIGDTRDGAMDHTDPFPLVVTERDIGTIERGARYRPRGNKELIPNFFHPDFQKLVDEGVGVCGTVGREEYCDKCNLTDVRIVFPVSQIPSIIYDKKDSWGKKNKKNYPLFDLL